LPPIPKKALISFVFCLYQWKFHTTFVELITCLGHATKRFPQFFTCITEVNFPKTIHNIVVGVMCHHKVAVQMGRQFKQLISVHCWGPIFKMVLQEFDKTRVNYCSWDCSQFRALLLFNNVFVSALRECSEWCWEDGQ
jgi:hypothetical protein